MSTKLLITSLLAGAAIGMLLAPKKGSDTRKMIGKKFGDLKDRLQGIREASEEELQELADLFKSNVDGLKDDVRKRVLNVIKSTQNARHRMAEEIAN